MMPASSAVRVPLVSVVIPCYNQARFLDEAIRSVETQDDAHFEIIVVDDGSTDRTGEVAARHPDARYVYQKNAGLSSARNTGLRHSSGEYVLFLDADDRLLPGALRCGRRWLDADPGCAFVSGHFHRIAEDGSVISEPRQAVLRGDGYRQLLSGNYIGMHATVMYRREVLEEMGGFDETLSACEDYDLYLRIAREHPIAQHPHLVAEYRRHGANMSGDPARMLRSTLQVLRTQENGIGNDRARRAAYQRGVQAWQSYYGRQLLAETREHLEGGRWKRAAQVLAGLVHEGGRGIGRLLYRESLGKRVQRARQQWRTPRVGQVRFGNLRRTTPLSRQFGYDRGQPVDRYYVESFLARSSEDIRGRVLEIGDCSYTRRFGGEKVNRADVLHVREGNPKATFIGDLANAAHLPSDTFDCFVLTQTLHLIYDVRAALSTVHRILKPGGILLLTVPGISQTGDDTWRTTWYWSFTPRSLTQLLEEAFPGGAYRVESHGNVLAATAFLYGLAATELRRDELDAHDPDYPMLITARVVKQRARE